MTQSRALFTRISASRSDGVFTCVLTLHTIHKTWRAHSSTALLQMGDEPLEFVVRSQICTASTATTARNCPKLPTNYVTRESCHQNTKILSVAKCLISWALSKRTRDKWRFMLYYSHARQYLVESATLNERHLYGILNGCTTRICRRIR